MDSGRGGVSAERFVVTSMALALPAAWLPVLASTLHEPFMQDLQRRLANEHAQGVVHYPPDSQVFAALAATPPEQVRVVILGQDPYHGPNQAHGLSFSVPRGEVFPPSLRNIFKELSTDLSLQIPLHGDLSFWASQGVLLLNSVLTVRAGEAGSHQQWGWERFTDAIIHQLNQQHIGLVFMLWGAYAQKKGRLIDRQRHLVLTAAHPSPLSANRGGWFGCRHFSQANTWLQQQKRSPIDWSLPE